MADDGYDYLRPPTKSDLIAVAIMVLLVEAFGLAVLYTDENYLGCAPDEDRTDHHNICVNKGEAEVQIVSWLNELDGSANINELSEVTGYSPRLIEDLDSESDQYYCWRKEEGFMAWSTICEVNISD